MDQTSNRKLKKDRKKDIKTMEEKVNLFVRVFPWQIFGLVGGHGLGGDIMYIVISFPH